MKHENIRLGKRTFTWPLLNLPNRKTCMYLCNKVPTSYCLSHCFFCHYYVAQLWCV